MTRRTALLLAAAALAAAATFRPASADVYTVTYTGTASGTDTNGVFGTAGAVLSSAAFTSTYTYDPSRFGNAVQDSGSGYTQVYGGSYYGAVNDPLLSATVAINGHTYQQGLSYAGYALVEGGATYAPYLEEDADSTSSNYLQNYGDINGSPTLSLTAVQSFAFLSGQGYGHFYYNGESISFKDTTVSVTDGPPTTVPEPASLALLGGAASVFGLAIGGLRRASRRRDGAIIGGAVA